MRGTAGDKLGHRVHRELLNKKDHRGLNIYSVIKPRKALLMNESLYPILEQKDIKIYQQTNFLV
jgi:hypothetical protein